MKYAPFVLFPALAAAAVLSENAQVEAIKDAIKSSPSLMHRRIYRDFANGQFAEQSQAELAAAPKSQVPTVKTSTPKYFPLATRKTIRYGPYRLPPANERTLESMLLKVNGITNKFERGVQKPCSNCFIQAVDVDLQYADGSLATTETGAWLHHTGLINTGAGLLDPLCGTPGIENFFEEGNERSGTWYGSPKPEDVKAGLKVEPQHAFLLMNEFVNMKNKEQYVWLAVNYEYMDGAQPDFKKSHFMLLSVGPSCNKKDMGMYGASNLTIAGEPKKGLKVFKEHSIPWLSKYTGTILGTGGHLHDGGEAVKIYQNDVLLCDSKANYGLPGAGSAMGGMKNMGKEKGSYETGNAHIANMTSCAVGGPIKKGDKIRLVAEYNFNKHPGMMNNHNDLDEVMGMAGFLVTED